MSCKLKHEQLYLVSIMFRFLVLLAFQLIFCSFSIGQNYPGCGADDHSKKMWNANPAMKAKQLQVDAQILAQRLSKSQLRISGIQTYSIPVVVHIIHQNGSENISDAQVLAGIQHLNDAYANAGVFNTTKGIETGIQFCLAKQDEYGIASSGITRTVSSLTNMLSPSQDLALKNLIRWDPTKYVNIWLVNEITSESSGPSVAGYAYFPSAHGSSVDGVVNEARYFGSSPDNSKIHIHELGHYLGLYHTFEGACTNNDCLTDGDQVCDTPPDASVEPVDCNTPPNSCTTDSDDPSTHNPFRAVSLGGSGDQPDMISNYMDYGYNECRTAITEGQKERMISSLTLIRNSLLQSKGCKDICTSPIQLSFSVSNTSLLVGTNVQFTNTTSGATDYQWRVNGNLFSSAQNPSYLFAEKGKFKVALMASNGIDVCTVSDSIVIEVLCNTQAAFSGLQKIKPGESISFTNTTVGAVSYQWLLDGAPVSTAINFLHTFPSAGGFAVSLVAFNGTCYDTLRKFVEVNACNPGNQSDTWYFGLEASIKFTDGKSIGSTVPFTSGTNDMETLEGCVAISDANGNFIFYSNSENVVNKNLTLMPNGSGLLGSVSATQAAAVQNPANPNRYYFFTLDETCGSNGFRYSEIDMTLDGGLGDVVPASKNTFIKGSVSEKITTVKHANGTDTWVIVHGCGSNEFYTYLVSGAGIAAVPVVSAVGTVQQDDMIDATGQLKVSPDGCKLAIAFYGMGTIELYDFNNATGLVSNPIPFSFPGYNPYGVEFSPNGSKLYVGMLSLREIYQFDLNVGNAAAISNSMYLVGVTDQFQRIGSFQIGPFGRIYIAKSSSTIAVINNPNNSGASCDFLSDAISLGTASSVNSLPSFSQSYFYDPTPSISGPDTVCSNSQNILYKISGSTCSSLINAYTLKGHGTIAASSDTEVKINFNQEGTETLIVERTSPCGKTLDSLSIVVSKAPVISIKDTTQCTAANIVLDAGPGFTTYQWQDNSTLQTYTASSPGKYWVKLSFAVGCQLTDTVRVLPKLAPAVSLGNDVTVCDGNILLLDAGGNFAHYDWQDHFTERTYSVFLPGKYWVTVTDQCGATASDTIVVNNSGNSSLSLGTDTTLCPGETIVLDAGSGFKNYKWQDGSIAQTFSVSSPGHYTVMTTSNTGCTSVGMLSISKSTHCCTSDSIPNLVTVNGDGLNDTFILPCIGQGWTLEVYDRWGNLMYSNKEYENEWPLANVSDGVYYFLVKKENKSYKGWVEVIR